MNITMLKSKYALTPKSRSRLQLWVAVFKYRWQLFVKKFLHHYQKMLGTTVFIKELCCRITS